MNSSKSFRACQCGATSIEYALIAAMIAVIVIASLTIFADPVNGLFGGVQEQLAEANERLDEVL
jgi:Flp pilus assembly protein, pilin Flp